MEMERRHERLPVEYRVYIDSENDSDERDIEICKALDISKSGIRLQLKRELAVNAFIHLAVEARGEPPLILVAVVRWCQPLEVEDAAGNWLAGLELQASADSDYESWCTLLEELAL